MIFKGNKILVEKGNPSVICVEENSINQEYVTIRSLVPFHSKEKMEEVLKAYLNKENIRRYKFCGVCGGSTAKDNKEGCFTCSDCGEKFFPSVFPAIIVAVTKGDKILLAHNVNFSNDMYSTIAGFVDQNESLEECVKREVFEEVGVEIKDISYFGSQFWGYSSALMIGFTAEFKSGEIKVDGEEIDKADWFSKDNLPNIPPKFSMGGMLIENFLNS